MLEKLITKYNTFFRYAIVGISGTFIDLFSLFLMTEMSGFDPNTDPRFYSLVSIAFLLAATNNYIFNRIWTFKSTEKQIHLQFIKFLIVAFGGYLLTQFFMWILVNHLGFWYMFSKAFTSMLVLTWNFVLNKIWTFKSPKEEVAESQGKTSPLSPSVYLS